MVQLSSLCRFPLMESDLDKIRVWICKETVTVAELTVLLSHNKNPQKKKKTDRGNKFLLIFILRVVFSFHHIN